MYICRLSSHIYPCHKSWNRTSYKTRNLWTCKNFLDALEHFPYWTEALHGQVHAKPTTSSSLCWKCTLLHSVLSGIVWMVVSTNIPCYCHKWTDYTRTTLGIFSIPQANNIFPLISKVLLRCPTLSHWTLPCITWTDTGQIDHLPVHHKHFKIGFGFWTMRSIKKNPTSEFPYIQT